MLIDFKSSGLKIKSRSRGVSMACTLQADCHIGKVALAAPEDIASAPAFLAGPDGGWVNGQVQRASGGMV